MNTQEIIRITHGVARNPEYRLARPVNLTFKDGEHIALVGTNGSGKTLLIEEITLHYPLLHNDQIAFDFTPSPTQSVYKNIKYITFRDSYGAADATYYYQQRWNSTDLDEAPLVKDLLEIPCDEALREELYELMDIPPLLEKKIVLLSSGELRRFQLVKTLLTCPRVLIMDNPYIGLDAATREILTTLLTRLTQRKYLQIILVLSMLEDIPSFITHVLPVNELICGKKQTREAYLAQYKTTAKPAVFLSEKKKNDLLQLLPGSNQFTDNPVIALHKVSIRYENHTLLKEIDWQVNRGEKWALQGENGSGKSTLLSLVCADNPQSYACDITLFGRKRGTGESIWEIKKHIGYVSPEMHRAYQKDIPALHIVASGLHDSIGLYRRPKPEQMGICEFWMDIFGLKDLKDRTFLKLSSGEQRLVLLARAFVKDPELLILDEPLHGLDTYNRSLVREIIQTFCQRPDKTLIMVTHYANELPDCIDHRLFLKKSKT